MFLDTLEAVRAFSEKGGSIVNISYAVSTSSPATGAVCSATKAAVDLITMVSSKELAERNIRLNAVNLGMIETEGVVTAVFNEGDMRN